MGISIPQLLILLVVVVLIFGTKKLRSLGKDAGAAIRDFKDEVDKEKPTDTALNVEHKEEPDTKKSSDS